MDKDQKIGYSASRPRLPEALGVSEEFMAFQERLSQVAKVERPVLLIGERGTGKELAASRLHFLSQRWQGSLVALNCAALSESVLESELFGHEAGAFTGATKKRLGRFEAAESGTLFLDEIGLIPIPVQEKILRAVEYGVFERVGSSESIRVDARIIGATNADLARLAAAEKFKQDLLDRLSFEVLYLPPLRVRREDIMHLARHFAVAMAHEVGLPDVPEFSLSAEKSLNEYDWPGNVRELKNVIERSVYRSSSSVISEIEFNPFNNPYGHRRTEILEGGADPGETAEGTRSLPERVRELELELLNKALVASQFRQSEAANALGLSYHQFRGLYRKHKDSIVKK